jgi:hypothetical protein
MTWLASVDVSLDGCQDELAFLFLKIPNGTELSILEADVLSDTESLRVCYVNPWGYLCLLLRRVIESPNHPPRFLLPVKYLRTAL